MRILIGSKYAIQALDILLRMQAEAVDMDPDCPLEIEDEMIESLADELRAADQTGAR